MLSRRSFMLASPVSPAIIYQTVAELRQEIDSCGFINHFPAYIFAFGSATEIALAGNESADKIRENWVAASSADKLFCNWIAQKLAA